MNRNSNIALGVSVSASAKNFDSIQELCFYLIRQILEYFLRGENCSR